MADEPRTIPVPPERPGAANNVGVAVAAIPDRLIGGKAITVNTSNRTTSVNLDISKLEVAPGSDPAQQWLAMWREGTDPSDVYRVPVNAIPADAPFDGFVYGRRDGAWVDVTSSVIIEWDDILGKPATFPPTLPITQGDVTGLNARLGAIETLNDAQDDRLDALEASDAAQDTAIAGKVAKAGDTMTGPLVLAGDAADALNPVSKQQWDANNTAVAAAIALRITDAPVDGKQYARKDNAWVEFVSPINSDAPADGTTYGRKDNAWAKVVGGATISDTPPASPLQGQLWWESDTGGMFVSYNDGSSTQWVQVNGPGMSDAPSDGALYGRVNGVWTKGVKASGDIMTGNLTIAPTSGSAALYIIGAGLSPGAAIQSATDGTLYIWNNNKHLDFAPTGDFYAPANIQVVGNITTTTGSLVAGTSVFGQGSTSIRAGTSGANSHLYFLDFAGAQRWLQYADNSNGNLNFVGSIGAVSFTNSGGVEAAYGYRCRQGTPGGFGANTFNLMYNGAGATHLYIDATNFGTINTTSDYRVKKDVEPLPSMWSTVKRYRPVSYTHADYGDLFKADDIERWGFLAHEMQEATITSAASAEKDAKDAIQSPNPWTIIAALTKALQEAMTRIEALEAA